MPAASELAVPIHLTHRPLSEGQWQLATGHLRAFVWKEIPVRSHYVATGYIYDRKNKHFLLIEHKKLGVWLAPGGHLEEGEEPHQGALREVREEIGLEG